MKLLIRLFVISVFIVPLFAQPIVDDIYYRIQSDKTGYLEVYKSPLIVFPERIKIEYQTTGSPLSNVAEIPENSNIIVSFIKGENTGDILTSIDDLEYIVQIDFGDNQSIRFPQLFQMLINNKSAYDDLRLKFAALFLNRKVEKVNNLKEIKHFVGNTKFLEEKEILSPHHYAINRSNWALDLSVSRLSLKIFPWQGLFGATDSANAAFGIEYSKQEKVLNILPYQNFAYNVGGRFLFTTNEGDLTKDMFFDLRGYYRGTYDVTGIYDDGLIIPSVIPPFYVGIFDEVAKLNSTNGFAADIYIVDNPWYLNAYYSHGAKSFDDPYNRIKLSNTTSKAFYSLTQYQFTSSVFFDITKWHKFSFNFGAGGYDVWQAFYLNDKKTYDERIYFKILPLAELTYNFTAYPANNILGAGVKYFDGRVKAFAWLKLVDNLLIDDSELRAETHFISNRFITNGKEWDNTGGAIFQLRYRLGFTY